MMIAVDVGNFATKFKKGNGFIAESSSVRGVAHDKFTLGKGARAESFMYLAGPAPIPTRTPYYVGDAAKHGTQQELVQTGSAAVRKSNAGYYVLHVWAIAQQQPTEPITLTLGLPMQDYSNKTVSMAIAACLKGEHTVQIGDTVQTFTVERVWFRPQPVAAVATLLYDERLRPRTENPDARRIVLDIGGGTTDITACDNLETVAGTQGGFEIGVWNVARVAADALRDTYPMSALYDLIADSLRTPDVAPFIWHKGKKVDISAAVADAKIAVANAIAKQFLTVVDAPLLSTGELILIGGGGKLFAPALKAIFGAITTVSVPSNPHLRVAQGLHILGTLKYTTLKK